MIYFTSDLHFNHNKPFIYEARGFTNVEDMNKAIIHNWNSIIAEDDDVYVLGDLLLGAPEGIEMVKQLAGRLHIILGNHDTPTRQALYAELPNVVEIAWATMITYKKWHFYLSHFPCNTSNFDDDRSLRARTWNLCGHTHSINRFELMQKGQSSYHVELDAHDNKPISIDSIIEDIRHFGAEAEKIELLIQKAIDKLSKYNAPYWLSEKDG